MSLKKQLILIFGALAFIVFVVVGITFWTFMQWRASSIELRTHYQRNLLLEQIRVGIYRAFKEVPDAVTGDDPKSREEFLAYLKPAKADFKSWSELPNDPQELAELKAVRVATDSLINAAYYAFDLVEAGKRAEAFRFMESNLEDKDFAHFQQVTDAVAASDRQKIRMLSERILKAQRNAQIVLVVAALGAVALILLLSAYISTDLFKPLRHIESALKNAIAGDLKTKLDEDRNDEIGKIYSAFNRLIDSMARKKKLTSGSTAGDEQEICTDTEKPSASGKLAIHAIVASILEKVEYLKNNPKELTTTEGKKELVKELSQLSQAVEQVVAFGFPQELKLSRTDISQLLYEVLLNFKDDLSKRAISMEFDIAPEVESTLADKLKLGEAVKVLVKNAIDSLPETGGKIGIRARLEKENSRLLIEVADNGASRKALDEEKLQKSEEKKSDFSTLGIELAKVIVEQHGGQLKEINNPERGNYYRMELPIFTSV